jgi:hypothetical protein
MKKGGHFIRLILKIFFFLTLSSWQENYRMSPFLPLQVGIKGPLFRYTVSFE